MSGSDVSFSIILKAVCHFNLGLVPRLKWHTPAKRLQLLALSFLTYITVVVMSKFVRKKATGDEIEKR